MRHRKNRHRVWASLLVKRRRYIVRWAGWLTDAMGNPALDAMSIRHLWTHFWIGSREDDDEKLREACYWGLRVLIWHPGFPTHLCRDAVRVDPHGIVHALHWPLNTMADPSLETERQAWITLHRASRIRQETKALNFALNYGTSATTLLKQEAMKLARGVL